MFLNAASLSFTTWNSWTRKKEKKKNLPCTHATHLYIFTSFALLAFFFFIPDPAAGEDRGLKNIVIGKQSRSNERGDISCRKTAAWQMAVWENGPAFPPPHWWSPAFCQYIRLDEKLGEIKPPPRGQLYSCTSASPPPVIKFKSAMMAGNSVPAIINHGKRGS